MKVLESDYILKTLDLPTIDWKPYDPETRLDQDIFWTIKLEDLPNVKCKEKSNQPVRSWIRRRRLSPETYRRNGLIGVHAVKAMEFGNRMYRKVDDSRQRLIYYPYYTVVKSGILDLNRARVVIEGTTGDITNLLQESKVEVTMIFTEDDVEVIGDERLFRQEEILSLIDHSREVRKMASRDIEDGKNIQLMFSFVYHTSEDYKPEGEIQLIFHKFKMF